MQKTFGPEDTITMEKVDGICSATPTAIHVVTTAQNLGIPALLSLEASGVTIDQGNKSAVNADGDKINEGDFVTISSRRATLFKGEAQLSQARLLRLMAGEKVEFESPEDEVNLRGLARDFTEYRELMNRLDVDNIESSKALFRFVQGMLAGEKEKATEIVNQWFGQNKNQYLADLIGSRLGDHRVETTIFDLLTSEHKVEIIKMMLAKCSSENLAGYEAGSFILGRLVKGDNFTVNFWKSFSPAEAAMLVNECVLDKKYMEVLSVVGERKLNRARNLILNQGLPSISVNERVAKDLMKLKLAQLDLPAVLEAARELSLEPEAIQLLGILLKSYSAFYNFNQHWSIYSLEDICKAEGIPLPKPEDV